MIYVDPLCQHGWIIRGRATPSCHMWTDAGAEELHALAESIGLRRQWFQHENVPGKLPHYDLTPSRRIAAVAAGAVELSQRDSVTMWRELRAKAKVS